MKDTKEIGIEEQTDMVVTDPSKKFDVMRENISLGELMELSKFLAKSTIVPTQYQNRAENCFIAVDLSSRMGISPMVVMQNLHIIQGKPSWSGVAIASLIRTSAQFTNVQLVYVGEPNTPNWGAYVSATRVSNGDVLKGATVTMAIAKAEGWLNKSTSKWLTMAELMLGYRAYSWFSRLHAPELTMGLHAKEELEEMDNVKTSATNPYKKGE